MGGRLVWEQKHKKRKEKKKRKKKKTRGFVLTRPKRPAYPKKIFFDKLKIDWNISFDSQLKFSALETCLKARLPNFIINIFIQPHYQWNYMQNLLKINVPNFP